MKNVKDAGCVIVAVAHDAFRKLGLKGINCLFGNKEKVIIDVNGCTALRIFREKNISIGDFKETSYEKSSIN